MIKIRAEIKEIENRKLIKSKDDSLKRSIKLIDQGAWLGNSQLTHLYGQSTENRAIQKPVPIAFYSVILYKSWKLLQQVEREQFLFEMVLYQPKQMSS